MNCKPGDLAVIRGCVEYPEENGRLVVVIEHVPGNEWEAPDGHWFAWDGQTPSTAVESCGSPFDALSDAASMFAVFETCRVFPIRDPGEDAVDETLLWLPSPHKEAA